MSDTVTRTNQRKLVIGGVVLFVLLAIAAIALVWWMRPKDIFDAAWKGDAKAVKNLLDRGVGVNLLNEVKDIPLHLAKTKDVAELLLSKGSELDRPNAFGGTPLHMAAINGRPEVAAVLIEHGAKVNALDMVGATPLDHAILGREKSAGGGDHQAVIKLLLSKGGTARQYADKLK
jgi:ankyrin repeat protein